MEPVQKSEETENLAIPYSIPQDVLDYEPTPNDIFFIVGEEKIRQIFAEP